MLTAFSNSSLMAQHLSLTSPPPSIRSKTQPGNFVSSRPATHVTRRPLNLHEAIPSHIPPLKQLPASPNSTDEQAKNTTQPGPHQQATDLQRRSTIPYPHRPPPRPQHTHQPSPCLACAPPPLVELPTSRQASRSSPSPQTATQIYLPGIYTKDPSNKLRQAPSPCRLPRTRLPRNHPPHTTPQPTVAVLPAQVHLSRQLPLGKAS